MRRPRVVIADDHAIVVEGLRRLMDPEFEVVQTVEDGRALLDAVKKQRPELVVVDISMPLLNGLEAARRISNDHPTVRVVILTQHTDAEFAAEAFRAGAAGYLLKECAAEELIVAMRDALAGRSYITPRVAGGVLRTLLEGDAEGGDAEPGLTQRQREVLQLVAEGKSIKQMARILQVSAKTVEYHKYNIMQRLDLRTTAALTRYAVRRGIVSD